MDDANDKLQQANREGDIGGGFEHGDEETVTFAEDAFAHTLVKETQAPRRAQVAFLQSSWMEVHM